MSRVFMDLHWRAILVRKLVQDKLKIAKSRRKSYADHRSRELEFQVGDMVFQKVSPVRRTLRFGEKGKLAPRCIGPFRIKSKINDVAYRLEFPLESIETQDVFDISMLKHHVPDPSHMIQHEHLQIREDATYMEKLMPLGESSLGESWAEGSYLGVVRSGSEIVSISVS